MYFIVHYKASLSRHHPDDYIREVIVDVLDLDENSLQEFLVGRISFFQILSAAIELDEGDPEAICGSHSPSLKRIWRHFMDATRCPKAEFDAYEVTRSVVVLIRFLLHPELSFAAIHVCEAALNLFDIDTLVVSRREKLPVNDQQLAELGFQYAEETNMIYRHSTRHRDYDDEYPQGKEIYFVASQAHESWVQAQWVTPLN